MVTSSMNNWLKIFACVGIMSQLIGCKPTLSEKSAPRLITNGSSITYLTNLLGEPVAIHNISSNLIYYQYFFHFVNNPSRVKIDRDMLYLTVALSNGRVCGLILPEP